MILGLPHVPASFFAHDGGIILDASIDPFLALSVADSGGGGGVDSTSTRSGFSVLLLRHITTFGKVVDAV